jgi:hypothetical protein
MTCGVRSIVSCEAAAASHSVPQRPPGRWIRARNATRWCALACVGAAARLRRPVCCGVASADGMRRKLTRQAVCSLIARIVHNRCASRR